MSATTGSSMTKSQTSSGGRQQQQQQQQQPQQQSLVHPPQQQQGFPMSSHTRQSRDYSHSTHFSTRDSMSAAFSQSRVSSGTFAVTSVDVPDFETNPIAEHGEAENESVGGDSHSTTNLEYSSAGTSRSESEHPSTSSSSYFFQSLIMSQSQNNNSNNNNAENDPYAAYAKRLAHRETQQIRYFRKITIPLFVLTAIAVSVGAYFATRNNQDSNFEHVFESQAQMMVSSVENKLVQFLQGMEQWSFAYQPPSSSSSSSSTGALWSTIAPYFDQTAAGMLSLSHASWLAMAPLISKLPDPTSTTPNTTQLDAWEEYTQSTISNWVSDDDLTQVSFSVFETASHHWDISFPLWQHVPTHPNLVNWDTLSSASTLPQEVLLSTATTTTTTNLMGEELPTIVLGQLNDENVELSDVLPIAATNSQRTTSNIWSMMYFPIIHGKYDLVRDEVTTVVTGVIFGSIHWDSFLQPPSTMDNSASGMVTVLETVCANTQPQRHAFQMVTSSSSSNDKSLHAIPMENIPSNKALLSSMEISINLVDILSQVSLDTSMILKQDYCHYSLYIYPTETLQDRHRTHHPVVYTAVILVMFLLASIIFWFYDWLVERRQRKVVRSAAKTNEIVTGLFPENVRNRLFNDSAELHYDDPRQPNNNNTTNNNNNNNNNNNTNNLNINFMKRGRWPMMTQEQSETDRDHSERSTTQPLQSYRSSGSPRGGTTNGTGANEFVSPQKPDLSLTATERHYASGGGIGTSRPIADLFPNTTVMFADIAGFTAWSSVRDPSQVFTLLETIYAAFDKLAVRRSVFKVETIGDCYVAVTGLPTPQPDHATIMAKYARDCLKTMQRLTRSLEVELGPDTGDLCIRVGLNSGPVTAGVLRGQKSRFQLFGDTVNTASRMESNGLPNQIQCSQQTADLLIQSNKSHWIYPRKEMVHAKGKGYVQTYWVITSRAVSSVGGSTRSLGASGIVEQPDDDHSDITEEPLDHIQTPEAPPRRTHTDISPHLQRLIDWNVDTLSKIIKTIVAARRTRKNMETEAPSSMRSMESLRQVQSMRNFRISATSDGAVAAISSKESAESRNGRSAFTYSGKGNPRDEYCEAIHLPHYDPQKKVKRASELTDDKLDDGVEDQLRDYVTTIACAYNNNPFHNFEHACHVTMSANKILKRVVNADHVRVRRSSLDNLASKIHDFTYGITSDPLTHFACLFSALIHDVDHPGISNAQMLKEKHDLAGVYDGKSIAEQNSFDFAWELLMDADFEDLRMCLFENITEVKRFRQLVINSIMATDVFDPELVKLRNERWRKAFPSFDQRGDDAGETTSEGGDNNHMYMPSTSPSPVTTFDSSQHMDLKATVVIEHIIQASDVAHTMQHWHVYQKWNRRLFEEMHAAYRAGRSPNDPAKSWYEGELWFYDNYIIPLAKKLEECRVFGASSDEFLTYAMDNRSEWKTKGEAIVADMELACTSTEQSEAALLAQMDKSTGGFSIDSSSL